MLHIVADENIPAAHAAFSSLGTVDLLPGEHISREALSTADVLLVRSITQVDDALLGKSHLKFVGSATIGTDHVDREALPERNIAFAHAPGSNAESVVEYVIAALLVLAQKHHTPLRGKTAGIIGCGNVGGRLAERLAAFGVHVLKNDPPLSQTDGSDDFIPLDVVLAEADILSFHVPLTRKGCHPTFHLLDETRLRQTKPGAWLINTSRGAVVDNTALLQTLQKGHLGGVALDVWETEPIPDPVLLQHVDIATPHIAGHSLDGKMRGTTMLYEALLAHFGLPATWKPNETTGTELLLVDENHTGCASETAWLDNFVRQMYDIRQDDLRLRDILAIPPEQCATFFSSLRKNYPHRHSFRRHHALRLSIPDTCLEAVKHGLCIAIQDA